MGCIAVKNPCKHDFLRTTFTIFVGKNKIRTTRNKVMPPLKIIADEAIPFLKGVLEPYARIEYRPGRDFSSTDIRDADVLLIRTRTRCNQQLLKGSPVRMIVTATIGFDHIDLDYCQQQGIEVVTAAGCNARGVLQYIGATLAHLSRLQGWTPKDKTLGIIGVGHVGSLIDEYARAWGFRVITCDPPRQLREHGDFLPLEEVARQADILTFHTPLDETTRHMVGTSLLRQVKSGTLIINASRGEVVDEEALLASGLPYVLDVWEHEPDLNPILLDRALLATPHIAGYSMQGKANATAMSVQAISRRFGLPTSNWYPPHITPSQPRAIDWQQLCDTIESHFDIEAESRFLKKHPEMFEAIRNGYRYREEYF